MTKAQAMTDDEIDRLLHAGAPAGVGLTMPPRAKFGGVGR